MRGYGNAIVLDHGDAVTTLYGHLKSFRMNTGEIVAGGSVIGEVGDTGNATTPHLHFELRLEGEGVDPEKYWERGETTRGRRSRKKYGTLPTFRSRGSR